MKIQIITMMGQQDSFSLMRNEFMFTIIWTMLFIIYFAYIFITASICAFEDGFDETIKNKGYPEDFGGASAWHLRQYLQWVFDWLPVEWRYKWPFIENVWLPDHLPNESGEEDIDKNLID